MVESSTTAFITWQPPPLEDRNGPIVHYNLILSDQVFGLEEIKVNVTSHNYTAINLEEYNTYSCIVAAASVVGTGPYSAPLNFTTEEDGTINILFSVLFFISAITLQFPVYPPLK